MRVRGAQPLLDGRRVVLAAAREGGPLRIFVADVETGALREVGPESIGAPATASPDGTRPFAVAGDGSAAIYPLDGGRARPLPAYRAGEWPAGWSADGRFLYLFTPGRIPLQVSRLDLQTGRHEPWRVVAPPEATPAEGFDLFVVSADGRSYAYSYSRAVSTLYVVEGLR